MTRCPWKWTLGKVMLQPGVVPSLFCSLTLSSLYQPAPCPLSFFFFNFYYFVFWRDYFPSPPPLWTFSPRAICHPSLSYWLISPLPCLYFLSSSTLSLTLIYRSLTGCSRVSELVTRTWTRRLKSVVPCQAHRPCSHISLYFCAVVWF